MKVGHCVTFEVLPGTSHAALAAVGSALWVLNLRSHSDSEDVYVRVYGRFALIHQTLHFVANNADEFQQTQIRVMDDAFIETRVVSYTLLDVDLRPCP